MKGQSWHSFDVCCRYIHECESFIHFLADRSSEIVEKVAEIRSHTVTTDWSGELICKDFYVIPLDLRRKQKQRKLDDCQLSALLKLPDVTFCQAHCILHWRYGEGYHGRGDGHKQRNHSPWTQTVRPQTEKAFTKVIYVGNHSVNNSMYWYWAAWNKVSFRTSLDTIVFIMRRLIYNLLALKGLKPFPVVRVWTIPSERP